MAELGSVFEDSEGEGARGPDLRVSVEVPRAALGHTLRARVPRRLAAGGDLIERAGAGEGATGGDEEIVLLHLPASLPDRALLRLRRQGGLAPDPSAPAGDLHVLCEIVERPPRADELLPGALAGLGAGGLTRAQGPDLTWALLAGLALAGALGISWMLL